MKKTIIIGAVLSSVLLPCFSAVLIATSMPVSNNLSWQIRPLTKEETNEFIMSEDSFKYLARTSQYVGSSTESTSEAHNAIQQLLDKLAQQKAANPEKANHEDEEPLFFKFSIKNESSQSISISKNEHQKLSKQAINSVLKNDYERDTESKKRRLRAVSIIIALGVPGATLLANPNPKEIYKKPLAFGSILALTTMFSSLILSGLFWRLSNLLTFYSLDCCSRFITLKNGQKITMNATNNSPKVTLPVGSSLTEILTNSYV